MTKREIASGAAAVILFCTSATPAQTGAYAEVMAGIAAATGLATHTDADAERVQPGVVGSVIVLEGLFRLGGRFSYSALFLSSFDKWRR